MLLFSRLLHIFFGVFWGGTILFISTLLLPAIQETGPDGGKVMAALARRRMHAIMPIMGLLTVLSGVWLYWHASAGFNSAYMGSRPGMTYGLGMITAVIALLIGAIVVGPSIGKAATAEPAVAQQLRTRAAAGIRAVSLFIALTVVAMAVARYL